MKNRLWIWIGALALGATLARAELNVLCTTFPIHLIARNVAQGRAGVDLQLMLPRAWAVPTTTRSRRRTCGNWLRRTSSSSMA
jgi:ABC-type Zn2+ transport system substrate-binding protein/surface adhesin